MQFYRKLSELRKSAGLSQEQLAEKAGVSRQTVFKWEAGLASPSMENILALCRLFSVSADELIGNDAFASEGEKEKEEGKDGQRVQESVAGGEKEENICSRQNPAPFIYRKFRFEYKSKRTLFGLPLIHICLGQGMCRAKGIVAIGNMACGLVSVGILSAGILSFGVLAAGLLAVVVLSLGGFALGAAAIGLMAVGAIAVGVVAVGSLAIGVYSVGAAAFASRIAATSVTGYAKAPIAVADGVPKGSYSRFAADYQSLAAACGELFPSTPKWILRLLILVL